MEIAGYIAALFVGVSLGVMGSGGSILTMPILVYLFGVDPVIATGYSLFIVGSTSLVGVLPRFEKRQVSVRTALLFGLPSMLAIFLTRSLLMPLLPETIFTAGSFTLSRDILIMSVFALLMLSASWTMIRKKKETASTEERPGLPLLILQGMMVGFLSGFVGAGGGFLIIPALVLFVGLPLKTAMGTSLLIIAMNSIVGFAGDVFQHTINWWFLVGITSLAVTGIFIGNRFSNRIPAEKLRKGFGWFILLMGIYVLLQELVFTR